jgi:hypothetical protein
MKKLIVLIVLLTVAMPVLAQVTEEATEPTDTPTPTITPTGTPTNTPEPAPNITYATVLPPGAAVDSPGYVVALDRTITTGDIINTALLFGILLMSIVSVMLQLWRRQI